MYLRCDGPFGCGHRISKDAIESIHVTDDNKVDIFTFSTNYTYGEYMSKEDADEVADGLCMILDGEHEHEHEEFDSEPLVQIEDVQERIGTWLASVSDIVPPAVPEYASEKAQAGLTKKASKHGKDASK